jgi:hypothetical protein
MELNKLIFLVEIFLVVSGIITLSLSCVMYVQTGNTSFSFFRSISKNWNNGVVIGVTKGINGLQCYNKNPFINDKWPGTVKGCFYSTVRRAGCGKYGSTVPSIPAMPYYVWRNTTLCSERIPATYLDLTIAENENSCPNNMRSCGIIDTLNNVMCVPLTTPCPYNYMQIIPKGQPMPSGFNYSMISMNEATLVLSNQNTKGKLIIDLMINEDTPCADSYFKSYLGSLYILENFYERSTCEGTLGTLQYDQDFELKDSYSYYSTYNENNILTNLNNIPTFNTYGFALQSSTRTMKLYAKTYVGIKPQCLNMIKQQNLSVDMMVDLTDMYNDTSDSNTVLLYSVIFGSIGVGFMVFYEIILLCIAAKDGCDNDSSLMRISLMIIPQMFCMVMFVIACIIVSRYSGIANTYEFLIDYNCVDSNLLKAMIDARSSLSTISSVSIACLIFSLLNLIIMLSSWVICYL